MGSPISLIVANLFMEDLEVQAIKTSSTPPALWKRFVDDTFTIIKKENRNSFLQHLNSIHPNIKFTCEEVRSDGSMSFLDILITPEEDGSLRTSVFRKPTYTDLYLQLDSHHTISSKYSVAGTLYHRAKQYAPIHSCCRRKKTISSKPSRNVNTLHGPSTEQN